MSLNYPRMVGFLSSKIMIKIEFFVNFLTTQQIDSSTFHSKAYSLGEQNFTKIVQQYLHFHFDNEKKTSMGRLINHSFKSLDGQFFNFKTYFVAIVINPIV